VSESALPVEFHPSVFPAEMRSRLAQTLRQGRLPASFLYESPAQAARWLAYHRAWSPSRRDRAVEDLYRAAFEAASGSLPEGPLVFLGLGCGGGQKDRDTIAALLAGGRRETGDLAYVPLDVSAALVVEAGRMARGQWPGLGVYPLVADLSLGPDLRAWLSARGLAGVPVLFGALGLLPNAEPTDFLTWLASQAGPRDALLISANLSPAGFEADARRILAQYDNPEARAWYSGALGELGIAPGEAELIVRAENARVDGSYWRIVVDARATRPVRIELPDFAWELGTGSSLRLFHSNRFTRDAAQELIERTGPFVQRAWLDKSGEEGIFLCSARAG
jgi:uncharacterized SAM-dependent methyltransferase